MGTYKFIDFLDDDGCGTANIKLAITMKIISDSAILDLQTRRLWLREFELSKSRCGCCKLLLLSLFDAIVYSGLPWSISEHRNQDL